jgi:hypothetical protein
MDPAYLDYLLLATAGFAATALGFAVAWLRARDRAIRAEAQLAADAAERLTPGAAQRLERLEQLAEHTALEVERVAEGQRFERELLAGNRPPPRAPGGQPMA